MKIDLKKIKHIHMVGIGGIGMSGLARILVDRGMKITGSDLKNNRLIEKLKDRGCVIRIGHKKIFAKPDLVVRSFCIKDANPEIMEARIRGIPLLERSQLLKLIFEAKKRSIAVTGAHGKTTTTAMISYLFDKLNMGPTVLIGGELDYFDGNAKSGSSDILISEVDESDGYFSELPSKCAVITNIEKDHLEHYKNVKNLLNAFKVFLQNRKRILIYDRDDRNLRNLLKYHKGKHISYGNSKNYDFYPLDIKDKGLSTEFICFNKRKELGKVYLSVPGVHNVFNALAAIACSLEFGLKFNEIKDTIVSFKGVKRRFEIKCRKNDIILVEDYAHHPTQIKSVISIARGLKKKRVIVIFQPHRFSRTKYLEAEFATAFRGADRLILTDIYAASENPIKGVSIKNIYKGVKKNGCGNVEIIPKDGISRHLADIIDKGDIILVLGAGDINGIVPDIKKVIKREG